MSSKYLDKYSDSIRAEVLKQSDDAHRKLKTFGELSSSVFSNGDLTLGFIVEGNYRCVLVPSIGDGDEMNSSPVGMFRWCCVGVTGWCSPANCDDADAVLIGVERLKCCSQECLICVLMFGENTKATLTVICKHLGLGNVKRVSLSIKDVVADDVWRPQGLHVLRASSAGFWLTIYLFIYLSIYLFKIFGMRRFTPSETIGYATLCAPVILVTVPIKNSEFRRKLFSPSLIMWQLHMKLHLKKPKTA